VINIGIGVCSFKRPELATITCKSILNTVDRTKFNISTVCSLDDTGFIGYEWIQSNFGLIYGPNSGISVNKNRLLKYLYNNDFIFLLEDDIILLKEGWLELYLRAIELTGYQHFNYIVSHYREYIKTTTKYGDITLGDCGPYVNGIFMVMSKRCLEVVGGFDEKYQKYGYEHPDFTKRCKMAGIYPSNHIHVMEATPFIDWYPSSSCLSEEEKKKYIAINAKTYDAPIKTIYKGDFVEANYKCLT